MNQTDTTAEAAIQTLLDARIKAIYEKDIEGVIANYHPDYVSFDLKEPLQNKGIDGIRERLKEWFKSYKSPISQQLNNLEIKVSGDVAFSHCLTRTFGTNIKEVETDMWYRTTTCFSKIDNKWVIVHQHDSEPIDLKTEKAMFDLKP